MKILIKNLTYLRINFSIACCNFFALTISANAASSGALFTVSLVMSHFSHLVFS